MVPLIGGSVLLMAGSAVALALGWSTSDETLIWTSVAASAVAAVLLAIAYVITKRQKPATATAGDGATAPTAVREEGRKPRLRRGPANAGDGTSAVAGESQAESKEQQVAVEVAPEPAASGTIREHRAEEEESDDRRPSVVREAVSAAAAAAGAAKSKSSGGAAPVAAAPAKRGTAARPAGSGQVVAIPERKKFHKPECRYAKSKGAETITKTTARRRGYTACGVCKP